MYVILTRSGLLFIYKMIQEIISRPKSDSGYPTNFMVNSWVFNDDESESEAKTNSRPRVCLLLVENPHFACVEHAQCPLLAHHVSTHTHTHTSFCLCLTSRCNFALASRISLRARLLSYMVEEQNQLFHDVVHTVSYHFD